MSQIHYSDVYKLGCKLVRTSDIIDKGYVYQQCPAFTHKNERTFIGYSPVDISFQIERSPQGPLLSIQDKKMIKFITIDDEHINSPQPVFQIKVPKFLFWTHDDDVWIEQNDHPMTSLNNNFVGVPAWFNLSNWSRTLNVSGTIVNERKPVIIRRGDPLFRISFYSNNLDDNIVLKQEEYSEEYKKSVETDLFARREVKGYRKNLFSKTDETSKCPFSFLFK